MDKNNIDILERDIYSLIEAIACLGYGSCSNTGSAG